MAKARNALTRSEEKEVARLYQLKDANGKAKYTQQELASQFFVAPVTIRRALAERGVLELVGYKTRKETELLNALKAAGIISLVELTEVLESATV